MLRVHRTSLLLRWNWKVLVVDEAHRLKDQNSLLHRTLTKVQHFVWFLRVFPHFTDSFVFDSIVGITP